MHHSLKVIIYSLLTFMVISMAGQAVYHFLWITRRVDYDYENTFNESQKVERVLDIAAGGNLYANDTTWPLRSAGYGELYYYAPAWYVGLIGLEGSRWDQAYLVYVTGRLISMFGAFCCLLWLWFVLRELEVDIVWRLAGLLLFFHTLEIIKYAECYRADFPMAAFSLWAWFFCVRDRKYWTSFLSGVLMACAFLFKQPVLVSTCVLGLWLLMKKDWKRVACYVAGFLVMFLSFSFLIGLFYDETGSPVVGDQSGRSILSVLFGFLNNPNLKWANLYLHPYTLLWPISKSVPFICGLLGAVYFLRRRPEKHWFLFAFCLVTAGYLVAGLHRGSYINFFLESYLWAVVVAVMFVRKVVDYLLEHPEPNTARSIVCWIIIGFLSLCYGIRAERTREDFHEVLSERPSFVENNVALIERLNDVDGEFLTTEGYFWFHTQSPPTFMAPASYYDESWWQAPEREVDDLRGMIQSQTFEVVLSSVEIQKLPVDRDLPGLWPAEVVEDLQEHYVLDKQYGDWFLYIPKSAVESKS